MRSTLTVTIEQGRIDTITNAVTDAILDVDISRDNDSVTFEVVTAAYSDSRPNADLIDVLEEFGSDMWEDASFSIAKTDSETVEGALWNGPNGVEFVPGGSIPT